MSFTFMIDVQLSIRVNNLNQLYAMMKAFKAVRSFQCNKCKGVSAYVRVKKKKKITAEL